MVKGLQIISKNLLKEFKARVDFSLSKALAKKTEEELPVDYFQFYNSVSSVYSSKIEGEDIDFDSFFKHKFLNVKYKPNYTKRSDDLFKAYEFVFENRLTKKNLFKAHKLLSKNYLPKSQRGKIRNNPMFVINENDRIEYAACDQHKVKEELAKLFKDIKLLLKTKLKTKEVFFYAAMCHLVLLKIHPFQDGNGRTSRLLEKWFLLEKLGNEAISIELEKHYYLNRENYYANIKRLGLDYELLDYSKGLDFVLMTVGSLR